MQKGIERPYQHFGLGPKSNSAARDTMFKFELPSDFAMSKMRFRSGREPWFLTISAIRHSINVVVTAEIGAWDFTMYEKVTSVTVRNRPLHYSFPRMPQPVLAIDR
jgi:hypothetical protein